MFYGKLITAGLLAGCIIAAPLAASGKSQILLKHNFNRSTEGWITPSHWQWNGKTERSPEGYMILKPTAQKPGSSLWGRSYTVSNAQNVRGQQLELSCKVRGTGQVKLGAMYRVLQAGKSKWHKSASVQLTDQWQIITLPMDFSKLDVSTYWMQLEITGPGQVEFDDVTVKSLAKSAQTSIRGTSHILRHVQNTPFADVVFKTSEPDAEFAVFAGTGATADAPTMLKSDAQGRLTVPGRLIQVRSDGQALVTAARNGVTASTAIELISQDEYSQLDAAAQKVKFASPRSIVCIADSLWDFDRGMNSADELSFWLNKYNANTIKLHNFAVAGDSIANVERRLNQQQTAGKKWVVYKPMLDKNLNPDIVFIQLGHNDTRAFCSDNFATPLITPAEQERCFDRVLTHLRRMWPHSRIILVTPVANDTDYLNKKAARELKKSSRVWRFGDRDKVLDYIKTLHKIAGKHQLEVLDVFTPMSQIKERMRFFRPDGVHLLRPGYRLLALEIMRYLASHPQGPAILAPKAPAPVRGRFVLQNLPENSPKSILPQQISAQDGGRKLSAFGKVKSASDGSLRFDGATTGLALNDSMQLDVNQGITFSATVKNRSLPGDNHLKRVFASYFFKHQQILFCRKGRQLYFNFFANNNWGGDLYSGDVFEEDFGKESYHHVTATVRHHYVRSQGEDWLEAKLYLDGELVAQKRYPNMRVDNSRFPLEIGTASSLSSVWHSKADFAEVEIFDRALTEEEVEELFFRQKMVSKKRSGVIAGDAEVFLKQLKLPEHELSSLRNLARSGVKLDELKKYAAAPQKYFRTLPGKESLLTLFTPAGAVRIISWYDRHTRRELLSYDAAFFSLEGRFNGKRVVLSPLSESVKSDFLHPVQQKDGRWSFTIQSTLADDAVAQCRYQFIQDRIELQVSLDNRNKNLHFSYLNQPDVRLNPLQTTVDHLLVPIMSGVAYPAASANGAHFSDVYPRGSASMQLGAYYDGASGVYWTTLDPTAGFKKFNFSAGRKRISASAAWPIPGASASPERNFTPKGPAALELFRGNWYDAGLLYRKDLQNMRPLWWRPTLPNTDTPQWFRNNAFVIRRLPGTQDDIPILRQLRDFLENKFLVEWEHDKASNQYSPMMRMSPETVAWIRDMHQLGLKTIPYTDPRLWQVFDRRDEDTMFSKVVRPHCIVEDGKLLIERYENRPCGVVCAVSPYIQQMMQQMMFNLINVGFDGIYADQVGAARPHLCEVSAHGHAVRDGSSHFISGWVPMFDKVRKQWQKSAPSAILATEDNAEHCVGMMDAMLPWRWMYEHQVPLYCLVYSGRTQFIGREPDCEEPKAIYPKAATQLVNSEQIGYIEHQLATSPLRNTYRVFLKQLIHLRLAMLDFFNCGMMSRPPQFDRPWSRETLIWGVRGTGSVTSEAVLSSAWQLDKLQAIVLVNHTDQLQQNTLRYQLLSPKNQISVWRSTTHEVQKLTADAQLKLPFSLPPRSSMLIIAAPEKFDLARQTRQINERFKVIVQAPQTPDLFAIDPGKMRNTNAGAATDWHHARHAAAVSGARLDGPRNQINWIRDAVVSVGTVDFADGSAQILEATFAAPPRSGLGKAEFYIDDLQSKNKFAEFVFDQKSFLTDSWNTFRSRQQKINQKITGQHRVFIKLEGSSFCNLQSWRMK